MPELAAADDDWEPTQTLLGMSVTAGGLQWKGWHGGRGPNLLLLHGTGSSAHSWLGAARRLAQHFRVTLPDLPGHGGTQTPQFQQLSLCGMAESLQSLLSSLDASPAVAVGHSAGAAILARMSLDGFIAPQLLVSMNGAMLPLRGIPGWLFAPAAKLLARHSMVPRFVARKAADPSVILRIVAGTGSHLDAAGIEAYRQLASRPAHVAAALGMMANWDLRPLERDLPHLKSRLALLVGDRDRTIPPAESLRVRALLPCATVQSLGTLGHLAHEEEPARVADRITELAREAGVQPSC